MLSDNISKIRKERGLTQEALAVKLHVVRQTVSKWEKGTSVPDAETLVKIAEALEVPVTELLGEPSVKEKQEDASIIKTLAEINEQLAVKNRLARRVWKTIGFVLLGVVIIGPVLNVLGNMSYNSLKIENTSYVTDENGLPTFESLSGMSDHDISEALSAVEKEQLHEVWGEPVSTEDHADIWEIKEGVFLKVHYDENGYAVDCGKEW